MGNYTSLGSVHALRWRGLHDSWGFEKYSRNGIYRFQNVVTSTQKLHDIFPASRINSSTPTALKMPKEHVRKRGKRKPKTEESLPIKAPSAVDEAAIEDAAAAEAAAAGIHPSRLAFMRTGVRPPVERPDKEGEGGEGNGEGEEGGDGSADWTRLDRSESEFPFGVLDPDVKAYFRNVEEQIKDWESADVESTGEEREGEYAVLGL